MKNKTTVVALLVSDVLPAQASRQINSSLACCI